MKKLSSFLLASLMLVAIGCSSDDDSPTDGGGNDVASNPEEETILNPADVTSGISIENATVNNGTPPSPTGQIAFTMDNTSQSAFLKNGFDISFNAPANYAGAYIQLASTDGTKATNYFDVSANKSKTISSKMDNNNVEIDVNFGDAIPPGKFCYILCIYDDAGNISNPVEVCVEVEAWGGNPDLVAKWNYTKEVRNGETILVGDINFCEGPDTISCNNGSSLNIAPEDAWCYATTSLSLELKEDGTYILTDVNIQKQEFLYSESLENCSAVVETVANDTGDTDISKGNWAYDEEEKILTLVEFEDTVIDNETGVPDTYLEENGYIYYITGTPTINGSDLIINTTYTPLETEVTSDFHFSK